MKSVVVKGLALLCAAGVAACSRNEPAGSAVADTQIVYDVAATKAAQVYGTSNRFISYAWYLTEGSTWGGIDNASVAVPYISNSEISWQSGVWKNEHDTYYWPNSGSLAFLSYSPSSLAPNVRVSSAIHEGIMLDAWDVASHQDVDFMVADVQSGMKANGANAGYAGVPTIFRHKLSMIVAFKVNTLQDYSSKGSAFYVTGLRIVNYRQKGSYVSGITPGTSNLGQWSVDADATGNDYIWYSAGTGTGIQIKYDSSNYTPIPSPSYSGGIMMLPQTFAYVGENPDYSTIPYLQMDYTVDRGSSKEYKTARIPFYAVLSGGLGMNRKITFNIVINDNQNLITWAPDMDDWTSGSDVDISI